MTERTQVLWVEVGHCAGWGGVSRVGTGASLDQEKTQLGFASLFQISETHPCLPLPPPVLSESLVIEIGDL